MSAEAKEVEVKEEKERSDISTEKWALLCRYPSKSGEPQYWGNRFFAKKSSAVYLWDDLSPNVRDYYVVVMVQIKVLGN